MTISVTVVTGGTSPERDVAFAGAGQVVSALRERGFTVTVVDTVTGALSADREADLLTGVVSAAPPTQDHLETLKRQELGPGLAALPEVREADVVLPVLHGRDGEGGELQAILGTAGVPFVGSDALGSGIAMAKDVAKTLMRSAGLATPDWIVWPAPEEAIVKLGLPLVVKPSRVGSSVGLSVIDSLDDLADAVALAATFDTDVLLESFVEGREFTVGVLGHAPLAVGEILPEHPSFDYECKYQPGMCREVFPADLDEELTDTIQSDALTAHRVLKLRDFSRADFVLSPDGTAYCLEVNTLPGFTRTSLMPQSAAAAGVEFGELCTRLCRMALDRSEGTKADREGF